MPDRIKGDLLQELRFTCRWVTDDTHIDITSKVDALLSLFVYSAHQLQQDTLFDNLVACSSAFIRDDGRRHTIDGRGDTGNQSLIDIIGLYHGSELINLLLSQRLQESILVLNPILSIASNICRASLSLALPL